MKPFQRHLRLTSLLLIGAAGCLRCGTAGAASAGWNGTAGDGMFETAGNWTPAAAPGATSGTTNTDTAGFSIATGADITLPAYLNIDIFSFTGAAGSFIFDPAAGGSNLVITGGGQITDSVTGTNVTETFNAPITMAGNLTITNNAASSTNTLMFGSGANITNGATTTQTLTLAGTNAGGNTIAGIISNGTGAATTALTVTGNWTLSGKNTYTGGTSLNTGGNLTIDAGAGGTIANTEVNFKGGTLTLKGAASGVSATTVGIVDISNTFGTVNSLVFNDNGGSGITLTAPGVTGTAGLTIVNTPGLLNISMTTGADVFKITSTTAAVSQSGIDPFVVINGKDIAGVTGTTGNQMVAPATYTVLGAGAQAYPNDTTATVEITSATGAVSLNTASTATSSLLINDTASRTIAMNGNTLLFGATGTFRGGTILTPAGTGAVTIGSTPGDGAVIPNGGAGHMGELLLVNNSSNVNTMNAVIADNGTTATQVSSFGSGAAWTLAAANTYSGGTYLNVGGLNLNNASAIGTGTLNILGGTLDNTSGAPVTLSTNNALAVTGSFAFAGSNALNLGTGAVGITITPTITVGGSTLTIGGVVSGGGNGLTKAGPGALALNGVNTYTGATTINAGTLTGTGTLAGAMILNGGGNITPGLAGTATGKLSGTSLTFNAGGMLTYTLSTADTTSDNLTLSGALTKGSTGTYTINLTGGVVGDTYDLVNYGSTTFSTTVNAFTAVGDTGVFTTTGNELSFTVLGVAAVPEPKTSVMAGLLVLTALCSPRVRSLLKRARRA